MKKRNIIIGLLVLAFLIGVGFFVFKSQFKADEVALPTATVVAGSKYEWPTKSNFSTFNNLSGTKTDGTTISLVGEAGGFPYIKSPASPNMPNIVGKSAEEATTLNQILLEPAGLALSADGKIAYVVDTGTQSMTAFNVSDGSVKWNWPPASNREENGKSITLGHDGRLYTVGANSLIKVWSAADGSFLESIDTNSLFDAGKNTDLYLMQKIYYNQAQNRYYILGFNHIVGFSGTINKDNRLDYYNYPQNTPDLTQLNLSQDVTVDNATNIFVLSSSGKELTIFKAGSAYPEKIVSLAFNPADSAYKVKAISVDSQNKIVHMTGDFFLAQYDYSQGDITSGTFKYWSNPGNDDGQISAAYSALFNNGIFYVGDGGPGRTNHRIQPFGLNTNQIVTYTNPGTATLENFTFPEGSVRVRGASFTTNNLGTTKVELSIDGGVTWIDSTLANTLPLVDKLTVKVTLTPSATGAPVLKTLDIDYVVPTKPNKPIALSPVSGAVTSLSPTATLADDFKDLDGGIYSKTKWQVATDADFTNLILDFDNTNKLTTVFAGLTDGTTYFWRASYLDSDNDGQSEWSDTATFVAKIDKVPPQKPVLKSPANNVLVTNKKPKLEAEPMVQPSGTALLYSEWEISSSDIVGTDGKFTSLVKGLVFPKNAVSDYTPNNNLILNTKYYWHMRYKDYNSVSSVWSDTWAFTINELPQPVNVWPGTDIVTGNVPFKPLLEADFMGNIASGTTWVIDPNDLSGNSRVYQGTGVNNYQINDSLELGKTYAWKVQYWVGNPANVSSFSVPTFFVVTKDVLEAPINVSPAQNAIIKVSLAPKFVINFNKAVPDSKDLELYEYNSDTFTETKVFAGNFPGSSNIIILPDSVKLDRSKKYIWRVMYRIGADTSRWSDITFFKFSLNTVPIIKSVEFEGLGNHAYSIGQKVKLIIHTNSLGLIAKSTTPIIVHDQDVTGTFKVYAPENPDEEGSWPTDYEVTYIVPDDKTKFVGYYDKINNLNVKLYNASGSATDEYTTLPTDGNIPILDSFRPVITFPGKIIPNPITDSTYEYKFNIDDNIDDTYRGFPGKLPVLSGVCPPLKNPLSNIAIGLNTVVFDTSKSVIYDNCVLTVKDQSGNIATIKLPLMNVTNIVLEKPVNIKPTNSEIKYDLTVDLEASPYKDSENYSSFQSAIWQYRRPALGESFQSIVGCVPSNAKCTVTLPAVGEYVWHVKYRNAINLSSLYSDETSFTVGVTQTKVWSGKGLTSNWSEGKNWVGGMVPEKGDKIIFNKTSSKNAVVDQSFKPDLVTSLEIQAGYTGTITAEKGLTVDKDFTQSENRSNFKPGNTEWSIKGNSNLNFGNFYGSTSNLNFYGDLNIVRANFFHNSGLVTFYVNKDMKISSNGRLFNNVLVNRKEGSSLSNLTVDRTLIVLKDLSFKNENMALNGSYRVLGTSTILVNSNLSIGNTGQVNKIYLGDAPTNIRLAGNLNNATKENKIFANLEFFNATKESLIYGNNIIYGNFTITTAGKKVKFEEGKIQTFLGSTFNIQGKKNSPVKLTGINSQSACAVAEIPKITLPIDVCTSSTESYCQIPNNFWIINAVNSSKTINFIDVVDSYNINQQALMVTNSNSSNCLNYNYQISK